MDLLIMSDIHGNLNALLSVLRKVQREYSVTACILLGDIIDYGMHSNEVIKIIKELEFPVICNIWGNHEEAIVNEHYERFSSDRGRECARFTRRILNASSWEYIQKVMTNSGSFKFDIAGKKCLAVHGSLQDEYWKSICLEERGDVYSEFDYVFSGHSHQPHFMEKYINVENFQTRNKKKIIFINPGSIGQPRNINHCAQFAILNMETERVIMDKSDYDIALEQQAYTNDVDSFYKKRLEIGI